MPDAADVAVDRSTYFREPSKLSIGAGDDVLITMSMHFNSNQGYASTLLILPRDGRFQLIDTINTFDENVCAYKRTQDLAFQTPDDGKPYAAIMVTATDATAPSGEIAMRLPPRRCLTIYRWDKKTSHYVKDSDAFEKLSAENAKRF
ncbi:hypothetical protein ACVDG5_030735 [Mesorhizobium sp. ORM6]